MKKKATILKQKKLSFSEAQKIVMTGGDVILHLAGVGRFPFHIIDEATPACGQLGGMVNCLCSMYPTTKVTYYKK